MISIISEIMTNKGVNLGATFNGISRQPGGHLYVSTVEKAGEVNITEAFAGRKEDLRNVSASIFVGKRMAVGTGSFNVGQKIIENGIERISMNDELYTVLANDDRYKDQMKKLEEDSNSSPILESEEDPFFLDFDKNESIKIIHESEDIFSTEEDFDSRTGAFEARITKTTMLQRPLRVISKRVNSSAKSEPDEKLSDTIVKSDFSSESSVRKEGARLNSKFEINQVRINKKQDLSSDKPKRRENSFSRSVSEKSNIFSITKPILNLSEERMNKGDERIENERIENERIENERIENERIENDFDLPEISFGEITVAPVKSSKTDITKLKNFFE